MADEYIYGQASTSFNWLRIDPLLTKGIRQTSEYRMQNPVLADYRLILGFRTEQEEHQYRDIANEVERRRCTPFFETTLLDLANKSARFRDEVICAIRANEQTKKAGRAGRVVKHPFDMDEDEFKRRPAEDQLVTAGGALLNIRDHFYYSDFPLAPAHYWYTGSPVDPERMAPTPTLGRYLLKLFDSEVNRRGRSLDVDSLGEKERGLWETLTGDRQRPEVIFRKAGLKNAGLVKSTVYRVRGKLGEGAILEDSGEYWRPDLAQ